MKITKQELKRIIKEEIAHASIKELVDTMTDFDKAGLDFGKTSKAIEQKMFDVGFVAGKQNFGLMNLIKIVSTRCAKYGFSFSDNFRRRLNFGYKDGLEISRSSHNEKESVTEAVSFSNVSKEDEMDVSKHSKSDVIIAPFDFILVDSDFYDWKVRFVAQGDSLIVLKKLDLTKAGADVHATTAADAADSVHSETDAPNLEIRDQAKEEFEKTGKIKGYEVLNLEIRKKLWISHYDLEALMKHQQSPAKVDESNAMASGAVTGYTAPIGFKPPAKTKVKESLKQFDSYPNVIFDIENDFKRKAITFDEKNSLMHDVKNATTEQEAWEIVRQHKKSRS